MESVGCTVKGVYMAVGPQGASPAVILTTGNETCIPIYIGLWEAISINNALTGEVTPRPLTHDLFVEFLNTFHILLHGLLIDTLEEGVYYASMILEQDHHTIHMDCRPSDGIAICIRCKAKILVDSQLASDSCVPPGDLPRLLDLNSYLKG